MKCAGTAAVVFGGGSGLGAATARALARAGAKVAVVDINHSAARAVATNCGGLPARCDVADAASVSEALAAATAVHGRARIAVNCAGKAALERIVGRSGPHSLELFRSVVEVNLIGTFNVLRLVAAGMADLDPGEDGERGVIINTASVAAFEAQTGQAAYGAAKAGVAALTLPAARELAGVGVRIVCVAPGYFDTAMLQGLLRGRPADAFLRDVPFPRRAGRPEEFADLVLHVCHNRMLNGEVIRLDGALRLPALETDRLRVPP
jgi:NAD(P)-dependent dehydrogenase (short-subunit alcohol dehydrogenase family)